LDLFQFKFRFDRVPHQKILNCSGDGHCELIDEFDVARNLLVRDVSVTKARTSSAVSVSPDRVPIQAQSSSPLAVVGHAKKTALHLGPAVELRLAALQK
jgi:hypothetical protein